MNSVLDEYKFQIYQFHEKFFCHTNKSVWKYDLIKIYIFTCNIFQHCEY